MYSQASQDRFVLGVFDELQKKTGYPQNEKFYLEIGAGHPVDLSNTLQLEEKGWRGLSIDISDSGALWQAHRKNPFFSGNACEIDYRSLMASYDCPWWIDYLGLDIDRSTNDALKRIPFNEYDFKVITIEHDAYQYGDLLRTEQREFLEDKGYVRVCSNVNNEPGFPFEDWWLHKDVQARVKLPVLSDLTHTDILIKYGFAS